MDAARRNRWIKSAMRCLPSGIRASILRFVQKRRRKALAFPGSAHWASCTSVHFEEASSVHVESTGGYGANGHRITGVNVICYAHGSFGLAEAARLYSAELRQAGIDVSVRDAGIEIPHEMASSEGHVPSADQVTYANSLIFINPDHLSQVLETLEFPLQAGQRNIGVWFWELEHFPKAWMSALELVDEIIVATHFVEMALREVTNKPVTVIPQPLADYPRSELSRREFGLDDAFTYLTTFDFNSSMARKNPLGVVEAFLKAFPEPDTKVRLLVKSSNGHRYPEQLQALLDAAARDHRIIVRDQLLVRPDLTALYACVDAYISLHRAEGYGLGMAEAMWLGKPVVATAYSGNLDFMNDRNSYLVGFDRVPVGEGEYIHPHGQFWAEPDIDDAARQIRHVYLDPVVRRSKTETARKDIHEKGSMQACGHSLLAHLTGSIRTNTDAGSQPH